MNILNDLEVLSVFDGISCARVALDRQNIKVNNYFASEVDKYAIKIVNKNYSDTIQLGDIRNIKGKDLPKINLLIGGSPCQDLSIAKSNRRGLEGEKSKLFYEYVRLLEELNPDYFILENVASMSKESKNQITKIIGYEPIMINAALVSAQNRKRLFWTNIPNVILPEDKGILLKDILQDDAEIDERMTVNGKSFALTASYNGAVAWNSILKKQRTMVKIGSLGKGSQGQRVYDINGKSVNLSANGGGQGAKTGLYAVALRNRGDGKKPEIGGDKANSLTTVQTDSMVIDDYKIRKLTPIECERLQGLPDNYTEGISNTQRYKCLGNGFNVDVIAHILSFIPKGEICD